MARPKTVVLMAVLVVFAACQIEEAAPPAEPDPSGSENEPSELSELIYVEGATLKSFALESGKSAVISELPSADVVVSPDSSRWASVVETSPRGATPEGFRKPAVQIGNTTDSENPLQIGPGTAPYWAPDSSEVLATAVAEGYQTCPLDEEGIKESGCTSAVRVVAYPAVGGEARTILGANSSWQVLGFTEDETIVALAGTSSGPPYAVYGAAGAPAAERRTLGFEPSEIWGVSPTEFQILVVEDARAFLTKPGQGAAPPLDRLAKTRLGDGAWSPDGRYISLAALNVKGGRVASSRLVLIDVDGNRVMNVPQSAGAQGGVAWSPDASSFAYTRAAGRRLEAVVCALDGLDCEPAFDWAQGVRLLGLR